MNMVVGMLCVGIIQEISNWKCLLANTNNQNREEHAVIHKKSKLPPSLINYRGKANFISKELKFYNPQNYFIIEIFEGFNL